ncbi:MAG: hypothetical protein PUP93_26610, partial [Rhizonema sp. NSF051]|nr:hypothetical protein [Rhizonema sp. NSF051]
PDHPCPPCFDFNAFALGRGGKLYQDFREMVLLHFFLAVEKIVSQHHDFFRQKGACGAVKEVSTILGIQGCSNDQVNQVIDKAIAIHTAFPEKSQNALGFGRKFVLLLLDQEA